MGLFGALMAALSPWAGDSARAASAKAAACQTVEDRPVAEARIVGVGPDGSLLLDDGRRFVPDHAFIPTRLEPARLVRDAASHAAMEALGGQPIVVSHATGDRHGRLSGAARLKDGGSDIATLLISVGAAYADGQGPCAPAFLDAEAQARRARRGLWAEREAVAAAGDEAGMGRRLGLFTVAEGRILAVGGRRERTYLNFGETWRRDFTIMVPTRDFAIILGQGQVQSSDQVQGSDQVHGSALAPGSDKLRGAWVRVRGVVREDGGPAIMIRAPAEIERLGGRAGSEE